MMINNDGFESVFNDKTIDAAMFADKISTSLLMTNSFLEYTPDIQKTIIQNNHVDWKSVIEKYDSLERINQSIIARDTPSSEMIDKILDKLNSFNENKNVDEADKILFYYLSFNEFMNIEQQTRFFNMFYCEAMKNCTQKENYIRIKQTYYKMIKNPTFEYSLKVDLFKNLPRNITTDNVQKASFMLSGILNNKDEFLFDDPDASFFVEYDRKLAPVTMLKFYIINSESTRKYDENISNNEPRKAFVISPHELRGEIQSNRHVNEIFHKNDMKRFYEIAKENDDDALLALLLRDDVSREILELLSENDDENIRMLVANH